MSSPPIVVSVVSYTQQLLRSLLSQYEEKFPLGSPGREHVFIQYVGKDKAMTQEDDQPPASNSHSAISSGATGDENRVMVLSEVIVKCISG